MLSINMHIVSQALTNRLFPKDEVNETVANINSFRDFFQQR